MLIDRMKQQLNSTFNKITRTITLKHLAFNSFSKVWEE